MGNKFFFLLSEGIVEEGKGDSLYGIARKINALFLSGPKW
jgi:hypothetical protein